MAFVTDRLLTRDVQIDYRIDIIKFDFSAICSGVVVVMVVCTVHTLY